MTAEHKCIGRDSHTCWCNIGHNHSGRDHMDAIAAAREAITS